MTSAQEEGWRVLLDLYEAFPDGWCIIGGQMVWLLAYEFGVQPMRATDDVDIVVDIRADNGLIRRLCAWLESRGFELEGIGTDNIGHRYVSTTYDGPGRVAFDILAPDNIEERAKLTTSPPLEHCLLLELEVRLTTLSLWRSNLAIALGISCALR